MRHLFKIWSKQKIYLNSHFKSAPIILYALLLVSMSTWGFHGSKQAGMLAMDGALLIISQRNWSNLGVARNFWGSFAPIWAPGSYLYNVLSSLKTQAPYIHYVHVRYILSLGVHTCCLGVVCTRPLITIQKFRWIQYSNLGAYLYQAQISLVSRSK